MLAKVDEAVKDKNKRIIAEFYLKNKTFVTKEELISKGFDFSEWFSTSEKKQYFDIEENSFEYKDFKCGEYYIKTRDKNLENSDEGARLFFEIVRVDFERIESELKKAISLLRRRKYAAGSYCAYTLDSEMSNPSQAQKEKEKLEEVNFEIKLTIPKIKALIDSLTHTQKVFVDLYERLQKEGTDDEKWI